MHEEPQNAFLCTVYPDRIQRSINHLPSCIPAVAGSLPLAWARPPHVTCIAERILPTLNLLKPWSLGHYFSSAVSDEIFDYFVQ
jgi:hypothetical protein